MVSSFKKKKKRNIFQKHFLVKIAGVFLLIIACLLVFADIKIYKNKQKIVLQLEDYKRQIEEIEKRNQDLEEGIAKADDKDYIEKIAREEFGMQQKGENVVAFVTQEQQAQEIEVKQEKSIFNIKDWLGMLGNFWQSINKK